MKPIIKWSGGKSQEIKFFKHKIPKTYDRYIEPFIGGGGLFFNLEKNNSVINDVNFELVSLYSLLNSKKDRKDLICELKLINRQRKIFNKYFDNYTDNEIKNFFNLNIEKDTIINLKILFDIVLDKEKLLNQINKTAKDKIKRIQKLINEKDANFSIEDLRNHLTTAFQSSLYFYCRNIYNNGYENLKKKEIPFYIANWYYVREFCFSSMFRFSNTGNFNVPYGGIGYNSKDFLKKVDNLENNKILHDLLENTEVNKMDFEELFDKYNYFSENDFIFLDPPYDSEFSQYNKEKDFDKEEQIRLRNSLLRIKSKLMIVIKETDFIYDLYKDDFIIEKFDKKYMTNMKNRNNKDVQHLIITNY